MNPSLRPLLKRLPQLLLVLGALAVMFRTENFLTAPTLTSILTQASIVGVLAIGQAFVLVGGGFDLSQGSMMALTAAVAGLLAQRGCPSAAVATLVLALGAVLGSVNGLMVAAVRTNPFVTTLSTLLIYRGAAFIALDGQPISNIRAFQAIDTGVNVGGTYLLLRGVLFLGLTVAAWLILRQTVFGQHVYALGGNAEAARLAGVRTSRLKVATFVLSGMAAGLATIFFLSWVRVAKPDTASGYELDSIAACVVGGVSLQGGRGSILGAAAGCLLLQALRTQITMSGSPEEYRTFITGLVILVFAAADALARRNERD
ncbi:Ribose transport system permease protein RbsC [Aquisphaera giovannonii]|uniref:Autoinducer 2 import system permease protein LsrD n=1 Tax=Aquisphaera giovannonii TaxID=406548 RepID=A0A5B9WAD3_9BACT|nr:ABC transporter permease [Aquisphaera giovannonii]QEH37055.1 Ribose transport system permease protein RbsC [Aquisphaera giovannonii]